MLTKLSFYSFFFFSFCLLGFNCSASSIHYLYNRILKPISTLRQHFMSFISRWLKVLLVLRFFEIAAASPRDAFGSSSGWWVWPKKALLEGREFLVFALFLAMQMLRWREQPQGSCTLLRCLGVETRRETDSFNWIIWVGTWLWVWVWTTGSSAVTGSLGEVLFEDVNRGFSSPSERLWMTVREATPSYLHLIYISLLRLGQPDLLGLGLSLASLGKMSQASDLNLEFDYRTSHIENISIRLSFKSILKRALYIYHGSPNTKVTLGTKRLWSLLPKTLRGLVLSLNDPTFDRICVLYYEQSPHNVLRWIC